MSIESSQRLRRHRWVVERTSPGWLPPFTPALRAPGRPLRVLRCPRCGPHLLPPTRQMSHCLSSEKCSRSLAGGSAPDLEGVRDHRKVRSGAQAREKEKARLVRIQRSAVDEATCQQVALGSSEWWHWFYCDRYWALTTGSPAALYGPVSVWPWVRVTEKRAHRRGRRVGRRWGWCAGRGGSADGGWWPRRGRP